MCIRRRSIGATWQCGRQPAWSSCIKGGTARRGLPAQSPLCGQRRHCEYRRIGHRYAFRFPVRWPLLHDSNAASSCPLVPGGLTDERCSVRIRMIQSCRRASVQQLHDSKERPCALCIRPFLVLQFCWGPRASIIGRSHGSSPAFLLAVPHPSTNHPRQTGNANGGAEWSPFAAPGRAVQRV